MPLEEYIPAIDDRRYDDIMTEVRTRISRYTREWTPVWTDVNENDPGITMVQVFAWLAEMLLYRMGKVPQLNYIKFLQLIGIELQPAEAAYAEITFPITATHTDDFVIIPARTQVSAESSDGGQAIVFETDRALTALTPQLSFVLAYDGYAYTPVTAENEDATAGFEPFGPLAADDAALLLGFTHTRDFPQVDIDLAFVVAAAGPGVNYVSCDAAVTAALSPATLLWERWDGRAWQPLDVLKDETRAFTRSGHVFLKAPPKGTVRPLTIPPDPVSRFWFRARLLQSQYDRPPRLLAVRTNTVPARAAQTVQGEVLGGTSGRRDQVFRLAHAPVLHDTLIIEVDEGDTEDQSKVWTRVDDFFGSGPNDRHYVLNRTTGEIRFGEGENGRIPVANVNNPDANVVAREYRYGGGKRGNLPARALKTMPVPVPGVDADKVHNLMPAHSARDEETFREAQIRARRSLKSRSRAVTSEDFETLAKEAGNVKRAKAMPLFHPDFPGVKLPGVVTVIVVPDTDQPDPSPSDAALRTVCQYLDQRRLLTTELYVAKPTYQRVETKVEVVVNPDADLAAVKREIENSLLEYFHPLKGGEAGDGWPFGGTIFFSRVSQRVFKVQGVQSVSSLLIALDGREAPTCQDVPIKEAALVYSTQHSVQVRYRFEE